MYSWHEVEICDRPLNASWDFQVDVTPNYRALNSSHFKIMKKMFIMLGCLSLIPMEYRTGASHHNRRANDDERYQEGI